MVSVAPPAVCAVTPSARPEERSESIRSTRVEEKTCAPFFSASGIQDTSAERFAPVGHPKQQSP
ncbi:hypothetical protein D3C83_274130 [compost metagenome]